MMGLFSAMRILLSFLSMVEALRAEGSESSGSSFVGGTTVSGGGGYQGCTTQAIKACECHSEWLVVDSPVVSQVPVVNSVESPTVVAVGSSTAEPVGPQVDLHSTSEAPKIPPRPFVLSPKERRIQRVDLGCRATHADLERHIEETEALFRRLVSTMLVYSEEGPDSEDSCNTN